MSVRSSQPTSDMDKVAYVINIIVIILAIISVFVAVYFIQRIQYYPYYLQFGIFLLILTAFSNFVAINGIFFFIKVYNILKIAAKVLLIIGIAFILIGLVMIFRSVNFNLISSIGFLEATNLIFFLFGIYFLYLGFILSLKCILSTRTKKALY